MLIRRLRSHEEYRSAEDLQREVWGFPDREIVPLNELVVAQRIGGHVLGAFERDRLAAFSFGIPALEDGRAYHYSRMTGVRPAYQDRGLGLRLKLAQRRMVLAQGLDLIRWTFDPLQSRNAHFNLEKLGARADEYLVDLYGQSGSRFNQGLPTDRFVVSWPIRSKRVKDRLAGRSRTPSLEEALYAHPAAIDVAFQDGLPIPQRIQTNLKGPCVTVEIPRDINALKARDLALAQRWRQAARAALKSYLGRGYAATGLASDARRSAYLLELSD